MNAHLYAKCTDKECEAATSSVNGIIFISLIDLYLEDWFLKQIRFCNSSQFRNFQLTGCESCFVY